MTGIRALAALAVVLFHLRDTVPLLLPGASYVVPLLDAGFLGVDVFFVLSGFIISYNYADRLVDLDLRRYRAFMAARIARMYPVHLVTTLVAGALIYWLAVRHGRLADLDTLSIGALLGNLSMLQGVPGIGPWNIPSWSVTCEMAAYVMFPLVAGVLVRARVRTCAVLVLGVLGLQAAAFSVLGAGDRYSDPTTWMRIVTGFTAGALVWRVWCSRARPHRRWDLVAAMSALAALVTVLAVPEAYSFVVVPLLVLCLAAVASATGFVNALLCSRVLQWGGRISYSLYLTHVIVFYALWQFLPPSSFAGAPVFLRIALLVLFLASMVAVAAATYYAVEEPGRTWLRRRISGARAPAQPTC